VYRGEHENLDECPVCNASWYKILRDDPDDVEDEERVKKKKSYQGYVVCSNNTTPKMTV